MTTKLLGATLLALSTSFFLACGGSASRQDTAKGTETACTGDGAEFTPKLIGAHCCDGLSPIADSHPDETGTCTQLPPDALICADCGNGACGPGENVCNCPADCAE